MQNRLDSLDCCCCWNVVSKLTLFLSSLNVNWIRASHIVALSFSSYRFLMEVQKKTNAAMKSWITTFLAKNSHNSNNRKPFISSTIQVVNRIDMTTEEQQLLWKKRNSIVMKHIEAENRHDIKVRYWYQSGVYMIQNRFSRLWQYKWNTPVWELWQTVFRSYFSNSRESWFLYRLHGTIFSCDLWTIVESNNRVDK